MQKILAKELEKGNIRLSTRLWGILTTHEVDMGNVGFNVFLNWKRLVDSKLNF